MRTSAMTTDALRASAIGPNAARASAGGIAGRGLRAAAERRGRLAETLAALRLMLVGYRILDRRARTPFGEIDIVAIRGSRLAFVEVKQRSSRADAEDSLTDRQTARLYAAAEHWVARRKCWQDHDLNFDAVLVLPWHWPVHLVDGLEPAAMER